MATAAHDLEELPRRADALRNRERVIAAAKEVMAERGAEVAVPEIAERAGVGKGTVYRNFPTKDDLLAAVVLEKIEWWHAQVREALGQGDAWEAFCELVVEKAACHSRDDGISEALATVSEDERVIAARRTSQRLMGELMREAKAQGRMREDARPEDLRILLGGMGQLLLAEGNRDIRTWRRQARFVADAFRA